MNHVPQFLKSTTNVQGAHYKVAHGEQHHQRAMRLKLNWYAGNITKYAERAPHKGVEIEDLIKVIDYAAMWLETHGTLSKDQSQRLNDICERLLSTCGVTKSAPGPVVWTNKDETRVGAGPEYVDQDRKG